MVPLLIAVFKFVQWIRRDCVTKYQSAGHTVSAARMATSARPRSLYRLRHPERFTSAVTHRVGMMLDGPRPMWNMKPVEKHQTAADRFWAQHQRHYESMESLERFGNAAEHNSAYPQLKDELERRRSTAHPQRQMFSKSDKHRLSRNTVYVQKKRICRRSPLRRFRSVKNKRKTKNRVRKSIIKSKNILRNPKKLTELLPICKSCQACSKFDEKETSTDDFQIDFSLGSTNKLNMCMFCLKCNNLEEVYIQPKLADIRPESTDNADNTSIQSSELTPDSGYPDTSHATITSYNSVLSMDQEPMLQGDIHSV